MDRNRQWLVGLGLATVVAGVVAGIALANDRGDNAERIPTSARDRAIEAALAHTRGGTVLEAEAGDDGAAYGIEIRRADGSVVEVQLDASFRVIGTERDDAESNDSADR
jgi:uncharacterized membrane protein YkoI